ncbi:MAG: hypothetical protein ACLSFT_02920 [Ruminococcus callidus]
MTCSGHTVGKGWYSWWYGCHPDPRLRQNAGGVPAVPTFNGDKDFYVTAMERHWAAAATRT